MLKKEQKSNLEMEILKLVDKYQKNKNVDCIYFIPFSEEDKNTYDLVVVFSNDEELEKCEKKLRNYSVDPKTIGGEFKLILDRGIYYCMCAMHKREIRRVQDLLSSAILFDRNGEYEKIAHQFDRYNTVSKYNNILDLGLDLPVQKKLGEK